jgi:hypothetical protein
MCDMCQDFVSEPYPLSGGRIARVRWGQDTPSNSDMVIARGYVLLPACPPPSSNYILANLRFGDRKAVMGEKLWYGWGHPLCSNDFPQHLNSLLQGTFKFKFVEYKSKTWREAMTAAWEHAHAELMKLEEALAQRQRALEEAECPKNMEAQMKKTRKIQIGGGNGHKDQ